MDGEKKFGADGKYLVRLRGLPYSAREDDIRQFLGSEVNVGQIHFTNNNDGKPSGEAYVQLGNEEEVQKAIEKHQQNMGSRYIEVFTVGDVEMDQVKRKLQNRQTSGDAGAIRLRGLPFSCKREDIVAFFKDLAVVEVVFGKEPGEWGRPTGEAYVRFGTKEEADRAMELNGQYLGKRYLELFRVDPEAFDNFKDIMEHGGGSRPRPLASVEDPWGHQSHGGGGNGYYPPPQQQGGYNSGYDPYAYTRNQGPPAGGYGRGTGGYGTGGAPSSYGAAPVAYGRHDPYAYGNTGTAPHAHSNFNSFVNAVGSYQHGSGELITPCKVHMRGLPYRIGYQVILDFFAPLSPVEIKMGVFEDGRASGDGIVEFMNEYDAHEAMRKDRESIKNRYIELFPHDQMKLAPGTTYKSVYKSGAGSAAAAAAVHASLHPPVHPSVPPMGTSGYGGGASWRY